MKVYLCDHRAARGKNSLVPTWRAMFGKEHTCVVANWERGPFDAGLCHDNDIMDTFVARNVTWANWTSVGTMVFCSRIGARMRPISLVSPDGTQRLHVFGIRRPFTQMQPSEWESLIRWLAELTTHRDDSPRDATDILVAAPAAIRQLLDPSSLVYCLALGLLCDTAVQFTEHTDRMVGIGCLTTDGAKEFQRKTLSARWWSEALGAGPGSEMLMNQIRFEAVAAGYDGVPSEIGDLVASLAAESLGMETIKPAREKIAELLKKQA